MTLLKTIISLIQKLDLKKIIIGSYHVLFFPKKYFSIMEKEGNIFETIYKTTIYTILTILIGIPKLIYLYNSSFISLFFEQSKLIYITIFGTLFTAFTLLIIGALTILIISKLCKGIVNFRFNLKIISSILILLPLNIVASYFHFVHIYLSIFTSYLIVAYGAWMLFNALRYSLDAEINKAKISISIISAFILLIAIFDIYNARNNPIKSLKNNLKKSPDLEMFYQTPRKNLQ